MRNQLKKLYNAVSAPVTATSAERPQSVCDMASLLYKRMMENMGYRQARLKNIVEKQKKSNSKKSKTSI